MTIQNKLVFEDSDFMLQLRNQMLHFATLQLSDFHLAEDAVQDALISAFEYADSFSGRSAYKTWVFAILKNKIIDLLRKRNRTTSITSLCEDDESEQLFLDKLFNQKGFWHVNQRPISWKLPDESIEDQDFWKIFEACLEHLPAKQAQVFMMREFLELESIEICNQLTMTVSNLNVLIYRARLKLRECFENKWVMEGECEC